MIEAIEPARSKERDHAFRIGAGTALCVAADAMDGFECLIRGLGLPQYSAGFAIESDRQQFLFADSGHKNSVPDYHGRGMSWWQHRLPQFILPGLDLGRQRFGWLGQWPTDGARETAANLRRRRAGNRFR